MQVLSERCVLNLCLVDGSYTLVEYIQRTELQVTAERIAVQQNIVQLAVLHQCLYAPAVIGQFGPDTAELIIRHLKYSCQTVHTTHVLARNLDARLVTRIVIDSRPSMLERSTQLQFEAEIITRQAADVMQRVVAETVQLVQFAFIH